MFRSRLMTAAALLAVFVLAEANEVRAAGPNGVKLQIIAHLQDIGDIEGREAEEVGTTGQGRRLEGFEVRLAEPIEGLGVRVRSHLEGMGDTPWTTEFTGSRGQSRMLEGFCIELVGRAAEKYDVFYQGHLEGFGWTPAYSNGHFCGTRGLGRRVEAIIVVIKPK